MAGLIALVLGFAVVAGLCAFLIDYDEALRHLPKRRARRHGAVAGLVAGAFFALLGVGLAIGLLR